jgi:NDP-sugar pyrophosphorylase family protein
LSVNYAPLLGDNYAPERLRVIIPVGGKATRLLPLTAETSKACIRLLNRPLVEFSLLSLARQGLRHFIFGVKGYTNYRDLYDYFESGYGFSVRYNIKPRIHIKYQPNVEDLGSADSVRINMEYYDLNSPVFAVQGDNIFEISAKDLIQFHREKGAVMTIVLREVQNVEGLGIADIDKNSRIRRFIEKPQPKDAPSNLANTGLYVISPEMRKIFKDPVYGYTLKGNWFDVGTPKNYLEAMKKLLHGGFSMLTDFGGRISEKQSIWVQGESNDSEKRRQETIRKVKHGQIELEGAVLIGRHCQIEDGVRIANSCIDNFTRIGKGAAIENSAVLDRVIIGEKAEVSDSIIGRHTTVLSSSRKQTKISAVSVVADDITIEEGCTLTAAKIYPHQRVRGELQNQTLMSS